MHFSKLQSQKIKALTFTCRSRCRIIPGAVGLATNDPLTFVVVPRVTGEHHHGLILILHAIDKPPPPMFYYSVANVRAGYSWRANIIFFFEDWSLEALANKILRVPFDQIRHCYI